MSAIVQYERLPSGTHPVQTTNQASWRGWSLNLLKPQEEFLIGLGKLMGVQLLGFFITGALADISNQGEMARDLNLHLTDTYYKTCTQAENTFITTTISTGIYFLCTYGYFLKKNQEKNSANVSPKMQDAIQQQIEEEIRTQLGKRPST
ncbi:hypothetical protein [Candidatus Rhabdochlamydia sp. T3358]|uniref:hypothetical protein n=1 Tax=Candidatus Rhabdochlamydia sp. T3358 TaxID=2099795 RepID=UPI0010BB8643|nr:hypothetical protein [Candidatus Rhabdochlamydia sp. T3358]VHO05200.1 hypothetical protein RHT_01662 [Candidatus Rhabdochlamydia sp. T3358]